MRNYNDRLDVCPSCHSHKIEYADGRLHVGPMHIRCTVCGVEWMEPCEKKVFELVATFGRDDEAAFLETMEAMIAIVLQQGLDGLNSLGWGDLPRPEVYKERIKGFWKIRSEE